MAADAALTFRFRPRYRPIAVSAMGLGALLLAAAAIFGPTGAGLWFALGCGAAGLLLGALYLASPAWRIRVLVDGEALEVQSSGDRRFRLPWSEVREVVASPTTRTCFVDGGAPERSLLVPGDGAPAPYDIEDRGRLYDEIMARVDAGRVRQVELLEAAPAAQQPPAAEPAADPDADGGDKG